MLAASVLPAAFALYLAANLGVSRSLCAVVRVDLPDRCGDARDCDRAWLRGVACVQRRDHRPRRRHLDIDRVPAWRGVAGDRFRGVVRRVLPCGPGDCGAVWRSVRRSWRARGAGVALAAGRVSAPGAPRASRRISGRAVPGALRAGDPDRVAIVHGANGPAVFHRRLLRARHRSRVVVAIPDTGHAQAGVDHLCGVRVAVSRRSADCPAPWRAAAAGRGARHRAAARAAAPGLLRRRQSGRGRIVGARAAARDSECGVVHRERERIAAGARARRQPDFMDRADGRGGPRRPPPSGCYRRCSSSWACRW